MKDGPAFQLYAADFYMDTGGWTPTQVGIYFRLLMSEWVNGSIPNTNDERARIAGIDSGNMQKCWAPLIEGKFTPNGDGNLINRRLEEVREKQRKYRESQSQKGKYSAEKRRIEKSTGVITDNQPSGQPEVNSSSSSLKDINNNGNVDNSKNVEIPRPKWYKNEFGIFVCSKCQTQFTFYDNLQKHFKEVHKC